jgi:hypothetical protein
MADFRMEVNVSRLPNHSNSINPTQTLHPDRFALLDRFVEFPKFVREHYLGT